MAPDDVVEDLAHVLGLVERGEHGADRVRPDLVAALDELDELVDDRARSRDVLVVAAERQAVAAQRDRALSRSRSASRTPSSTPASSAATSFETSSTCCIRRPV